MPRIPREIILSERRIVHKTIHSHHKEKTFEFKEDKEKYLFFLFRTHSINHSQLHAYCIIPNHIHELYTVENQKEFSNFMRDHLSLYGQFYNRKYDRKGRITNERPHTTLVLNDQHEMYSVFYIHANALDTGVKNVDDYEFSTHHLYSYGIKNNFTKNVILPRWYLELGQTDSDRQSHYRTMFDEYLRNKMAERLA